MRHTVRSFRKAGYCRKVIKGAQADFPQNGSKAVDQQVVIFKGAHCFTDFLDKNRNPANKRKSPWKARELERARMNNLRGGKVPAQAS